MKEKTFEWGGAVFTVKPATIGNRFYYHIFLNAVNELRPDTYDSLRFYFSKAMAQTTVEGTLDWQAPHPGDDASTIAVAFDEWLELPPDLGDLWLSALGAVDKPLVDEELQPGVDVNDLDPKD